MPNESCPFCSKGRQVRDSEYIELPRYPVCLSCAGTSQILDPTSQFAIEDLAILCYADHGETERSNMLRVREHGLTLLFGGRAFVLQLLQDARDKHRNQPKDAIACKEALEAWQLTLHHFTDPEAEEKLVDQVLDSSPEENNRLIDKTISDVITLISDETIVWPSECLLQTAVQECEQKRKAIKILPEDPLMAFQVRWLAFNAWESVGRPKGCYAEQLSQELLADLRAHPLPKLSGRDKRDYRVPRKLSQPGLTPALVAAIEELVATQGSYSDAIKGNILSIPFPQPINIFCGDSSPDFPFELSIWHERNDNRLGELPSFPLKSNRAVLWDPAISPRYMRILVRACELACDAGVFLSQP